jgi:HK97 gp10 family phage protein
MPKAETLITLVGDKQLQAQLNNLTDAVLVKVMRPASAAAVRVIQAEAKRNAKPGNGIISDKATGTLRKAIKISAKVKRPTRVIAKVYVDKKTEATIVTKSGKKKRHVPGFIAHLVEFGHGGPAPARPHPFLRPAKDTKQKEAERALTRVARRELPRAVSDARGKGKQITISGGGV